MSEVSSDYMKNQPKIYSYKNPEETPYYGLLSNGRNRFFLVEPNYEILKFVQLIYSSQELMCIVHLPSLESKIDVHGINNTNCMLHTIENAKFMHFEVDLIDAYKFSLIESTEPTEADIDTQKKLKIIRDFIYKLNSSVNSVEEKYCNRIIQQSMGIVYTKKFLQMISPDDKNIASIADRDVVDTQSYKSVIGGIRSNLTIMINSIDYSQSSANVKTEIRSRVNDWNTSDVIGSSIKQLLVKTL
jgi:hypothetical protein